MKSVTPRLQLVEPDQPPQDPPPLPPLKDPRDYRGQIMDPVSRELFGHRVRQPGEKHDTT